MASTDTLARDSTFGERALQVLSLMPAGEFTLQAFVTAATPPSTTTGGDVWPMMKYLIDANFIRRPVEPSGKQACWVRCTEAMANRGSLPIADDCLRSLGHQLPAGPFTLDGFVDHANSVGITISGDQGRRTIDRLTEAQVLRQLDGIDMWVRC